MTKLTLSNFKSEVEECTSLVVIDIYADWCGPCKMLAPIIDELAESREDIKVCKIDVDNEPELAMQFRIMSIPTVLAFKNGEVTGQSVGLRSKEQLEAML